MKGRIKWVENVMFVAESGTGHGIVLDGAPEPRAEDRWEGRVLAGPGGLRLRIVGYVTEDRDEVGRSLDRALVLGTLDDHHCSDGYSWPPIEPGRPQPSWTMWRSVPQIPQ